MNNFASQILIPRYTDITINRMKISIYLLDNILWNKLACMVRNVCTTNMRLNQIYVAKCDFNAHNYAIIVIMNLNFFCFDRLMRIYCNINCTLSTHDVCAREMCGVQTKSDSSAFWMKCVCSWDDIWFTHLIVTWSLSIHYFFFRSLSLSFFVSLSLCLCFSPRLRLMKISWWRIKFCSSC